jgi:hypothetical protein
MVSCLATNNFIESWLIDSGYTNHMTNDWKLFRELNKNVIFKVKIKNGSHLTVEDKGTIAIKGHSSLKLI